MTPVIQTLSQFLGVMFAERIAKQRAKAQPIESETYAKAAVEKAIADEAARLVVADEAFIRRAAEAHIADVVRKYDNREAIAVAAHEDLLKLPPPEGTPPPDEDWLNAFGARAELASSERLRTLWAKVLAGEMREPGSFSLGTLRCISELDPKVAAAFEALAPYAMRRVIPWIGSVTATPFRDVLAMDHAGLLTASDLECHVTLDADGDGHFAGRGSTLVIEGAPGARVAFPIKAVSQFGDELLSVIGVPTSLDTLRGVAARLSKARLTRVSAVGQGLDADGSTVIQLWAKEDDGPPPEGS